MPECLELYNFKKDLWFFSYARKNGDLKIWKSLYWMVILGLPQRGKIWDKSRDYEKNVSKEMSQDKKLGHFGEKVLEPDSNEVSKSFNDAV